MTLVFFTSSIVLRENSPSEIFIPNPTYSPISQKDFTLNQVLTMFKYLFSFIDASS